MKIKELKEMLNSVPDHYIDQEVQVVINSIYWPYSH